MLLFSGVIPIPNLRHCQPERFFGVADRGRELLFGLLGRFLPTPAFQLISNTFSEIIQSNGPLKMSLGILASLWSASLGMGAVIDTLKWPLMLAVLLFAFAVILLLCSGSRRAPLALGLAGSNRRRLYINSRAGRVMNVSSVFR